MAFTSILYQGTGFSTGGTIEQALASLTSLMGSGKATIIGTAAKRNGELIFTLAGGTAPVGSMTSVSILKGKDLPTIQALVSSKISPTNQPVGSLIVRGNSLYQLMGTFDGVANVPSASASTAGVVKQLANIKALASDAPAATIVTALNSLFADAKTKGLMIADS